MITAKKLDSIKIEKARHEKKTVTRDEKENVRQEILTAIDANRTGKRIVTAINPKDIKITDSKTKKMRVCAYCRVSTQEDVQTNSFEMQKQHFLRLINENPNYSLVKIYADEGISGTSIKNRAGFNSMMDDCRNGKIDLILTKSISRFGRNIVDVLSAIQELSELSPPVSVYFENEGVGTSDGRTSLIITVLSAIAEMESQQKSIAIKAGIRYRMQEGIYKYGTSSTLGYYRDYTGRVKIEPAEAEIVRYIYDAFIEGATYSSIADSLTYQKILSPTGKKKWRSETIRSILTNEKYCGDVLYQKTYVKNFKSHVTVKNDSVLTKWYVQNDHEAIISREKWSIVQELVKNYAPSRKHVGARSYTLMPNFFRIKSGALRGFYLLDMSWNKSTKNSFINLIKNNK